MRPRQLAFRARRLIPPGVLALGLSDLGGQEWRALAQGVGREVAPQSGPLPPPHETGSFAAVGAEREVDDERLWTDDRDGLLFLFHLHGFSDLARYVAGTRDAAGDAFWSGVVARWLGECGRPSGVAWHPYPLSGRLLAWCAALSNDGWTDALRHRMTASVSLGTAYLRRSVEYDVGGNHVLRNAAALVVAGACTADANALQHGIRVLERELPLQFLADGGHEERSPSYHRAVLAALSDAATVLGRAGRDLSPLHETLAHGEEWLGSLATRWGDLPVLNDGWDGPPLSDAAIHADEQVKDLAGSGYVVVREGTAQAVFDVGALAPPHLPAHAHADALSFVLWAGGRPVVVDPGSGSYGGPQRAVARATRSHSTVEVDGHDQCEFWGPFRAAHMPQVARGTPARHKGSVTLTASHDGYRRLPDPVRHTRTFVWLGEAGLVVVDRLEAVERHEVLCRIPLAEGLSAAEDAALPGDLRLRHLGQLGPRRVVSGPRFPHFGKTVAIEMAEVGGAVAPGERFGWSILRAGYDAELCGGELRVSGPGLNLRLIT
jgi:hypothetical protein